MGHFAGVGAGVFGEVWGGGIEREIGAFLFIDGRRTVEFDKDLATDGAARAFFVIERSGVGPTESMTEPF